MSKSEIQTIQIPPVSSEFATQLRKVFRPVVMQPGVSKDDALYAAGQQSVLEYIDRHVVTKVMSGNPDDLKDNKQSMFDTGILNKMFGKGSKK